MPASCSYCGSPLNLGLKFCVVCGRHTSSSDLNKMGGLKSGIHQSDLTRRLNEIPSSQMFNKARKPYQFRQHLRFIFINLLYLSIAVALFFCAIRFVVEAAFPGRVHGILTPLFGKHAPFVEQTRTGKSSRQKDQSARKHGKKKSS